MFIVVVLYYFILFDDYVVLKQLLYDLVKFYGVIGLLLLVCEGINGMIVGSWIGIDVVLNYICNLLGCVDFEWKESIVIEQFFGWMKV